LLSKTIPTLEVACNQLLSKSTPMLQAQTAAYDCCYISNRLLLYKSISALEVQTDAF